jgi:hypothetical protein
MIYMVIGLVIAAALVVVVLARSHESSSPLKTVSDFKTGLEKISPDREEPTGPASETGSDDPERPSSAESA